MEVLSTLRVVWGGQGEMGGDSRAQRRVCAGTEKLKWPGS